MRESLRNDKEIQLKQGPAKEEWFKFFLLTACILLPLIVSYIICLVRQEDMVVLLTFATIVYLPFVIITVLISLIYLEYFYIYDDRIEARCIYGLKNIAYFDKLLSIDVTKINLTARGAEKEFYIFRDGRADSRNILNINSCYNRRKYTLRVHKTEALEAFIHKNHLRLRICNSTKKEASV